MNDYEYLRRKQLFDPIDVNAGMDVGMGGGPPTFMDPYQTDMGPNQTSVVQNPIQDLRQQSTLQAPRVDPAKATQDMMDAINKIYTPSTVDRDRFRALLDAPPEFQQPSGASRWAAGLMALGERSRQGGDPLKVMDNVLLGDYGRQMDEWKAKATPYAQATQYEQQGNVNERNLAQSVVTSMTQANKLAEAQRVADAKLENERRRIQILDFKAKNPNYVFDFSGPIAYAYDPGNPSAPRVPVGETGNIDDLTRITLNNASRERAAAIAAGGAAERNVQAGATSYVDPATGTVYAGNPRAPQQPAQPIAGLPSGAGRVGTTPNTQLERNRVDDATMRTFLNQYPEMWDHVAHDGKGNNIVLGEVPKPPSGWFGQSKEDWDAYYMKMERYNKMKQLLAPGSQPDPIVGWDTPAGNRPANRPGAGGTPTPIISDYSRTVTPQGPVRTTATSDMVRVRDAKGKVGTIPRANLEIAKRRGAVEIP